MKALLRLGSFVSLKVTLSQRSFVEGKKNPETCDQSFGDHVSQGNRLGIDCTTASATGTTSGGMCVRLPRGDICARDTSLRRSTCFPAFRVVTTLSCGQARFLVHDPRRKGLVCRSWASACTPALASNLVSIFCIS